MGKENFFQNALSNFIFEAACGGAVRHLAELGYTSGQIAERLSFPVSYEWVREAVTQYFLEEGVLLDQEPAGSRRQERYVYVQDHGKYGRVSFRRVPVEAEPEDIGAGDAWSEQAADGGELAAWLRQSADGSGAAKAYVSCEFARAAAMPDDAVYSAALDGRQREYLQGICWDVFCEKGRPGYHLLNARMREMVIRLCESNLFFGRVYLMTARKIFIVERAEEA